MDKSKSNQTELTYKCGIGVASVNVYTGRMKFEVPIFSIGANSFQIATSLIYNFHLRNNDFGNRKIGLGNGWKINIQQYVFPYHKDYCIEEFATGDYVYIDSNCSIHRFVKYKEKKIGNETINVYYDTLGNGLRLQVGKQYGIEIYDSHHNILKFNSDGKIIEIVSGVHPDIKKKIEYDINGNLISIYDIRKKTRSINFVYNDKQELTTISINNTKFTQNLTYQSGKFIKLSKQSDTNIKDVMYFRCVENEEGNLKEVIDADSLEALIFAYVFDAKIPDERLYKIIIGAATRKIITDSLDADTFSGEDKYFSHNQYIKNHSKKVKDYELKISYTKNSIDYTYEKNYTDCRNEKGITTRYYFNLKGQTISAFDVNGQYYYSLYKPQGWRLFNGGHGDVLIDGEQSIKINSDTCILQAKNENSFAKVFGGENNKYKFTENFELSFWAKCSHDIENDIKIWVMYDGAYGITCETILDKTYKDTWQYVTIPIKLGEKKFLDKQYCIYIYGLPSGHTLEIADVTIKQDVGSIIKIFDENKEFTFSKQREKLSTEDKYVRKLSIVYNINGEEFDNYITSHFFMTDSDVYQTYKNIFNKQNPNDSFDLIYCNGTKVIEVDNVKIRMNATQLTNIEDIEFKVDKGIPNYYSVSADRIENSTYHISEIIHSFHYDSNTNQTYYGTNTFEELTTHLMRIDDWRELKQLAIMKMEYVKKKKMDMELLPNIITIHMVI